VDANALQRAPQNGDTPSFSRQGVGATSPDEKGPVISVAVKEQAQQAPGSVFSMDRELPLRGREAVSAYLQTSQLLISSDQGELLGVDLYA
jgi:hypothetical protein